MIINLFRISVSFVVKTVFCTIEKNAYVDMNW